MGAPWEKYQDEQKQGPWAKYQAPVSNKAADDGGLVGALGDATSALAKQAADVKDPIGLAADALVNTHLGRKGLSLAGYPAGLARTETALELGQASPEDMMNAAKGEAPKSSDYLKRAGVPEMGSADVPFGKLLFGHNVNVTGRDALGAIADAAQDPVMYAVPDAKALSLEGMSPVLKSAIAKASEMTSGVPKDAVMRLMERPNQVLSPSSALDVGRAARAELAAKNAEEGARMGAARDQFTKNFGERPIDTQPALEDNQNFLAKKNPIAGEPGALSEQEADSLSDLRNRLTTNGGPFKSAHSLQNFADFLDSQITRFRQSATPGSAATPYQAQLQRMYGQVKDLLHKADPQGLGAADARYSGFADDANNLSRLNDDKNVEGFVNNYFGKNNGAIRESAEKIIPNAAEDIADLGASRAFSAQGPAGSHAGLRNMVTIGAEGAALHQHSPLLAAAGAIIQPQVQKQLIGRSAQALQAIGSAPWFQALVKNPQMVQAIANPELRGLVSEAMSQIPQSLRETAGGGEDKGQAHYDPSEQKVMPAEIGKEKFLQGN